MTYPNLTLQIRNNIPSLEWFKAEGESQQIILGKTGLDTLLMKAADILQLSHDEQVEALMAMQREGDAQFWLFPEIDAFKQDFALDYLLAEVEKASADYSLPNEEMSAELKSQLRTYWQSDMLASFLEEIYNVLIAQTFYTAAELAIPTIVLKDYREDARLREKMAKELTVVPEIEFLVAEQSQ